MSDCKLESSVERYCPVCDAQDVLVRLSYTKRQDGSIEIECPKCSYKRVAVKDEATA